MKEVKVLFSNGDTITTRINGTKEEILQYYKVGKIFNLGCESDNLQRVVKVEFI